MVGDVERSGDKRLGEGGDVIWSSAPSSVFRGSSFCALVKGKGEPSPVAVDTEDMLEYRLPKLLSANVELALDGDRDRSSTIS